MYGITEDGQIWSYYKSQYISPAISKIGYYYVCIKNKDRERKHMYVHRLVALAYIPNPDDKPDVNHKDGDKSNNHVNNLEWITKSDNTVHALRNDLFPWERSKQNRTHKTTKFLIVTCKYENNLYQHPYYTYPEFLTKDQIQDALCEKLNKQIEVIDFQEITKKRYVSIQKQRSNSKRTSRNGKPFNNSNMNSLFL
jgi:hypothetical protein